MDILSMCRICLVRDIPLRNIHNTRLQDIYEKLTKMPFETKSRRPLYICYICCAKLSNCLRLQMKCLQSEEMFTQMSHNNMFKLPVEKTNRFRINHPFINISITPDELKNSFHCDNIKKEALNELENVEIKEEYIEDLLYNAEEKNYILSKDCLNHLKNENCADEFDLSDYNIQAMPSNESRTPKHCVDDNKELQCEILMPEFQNNSSHRGRNSQKLEKYYTKTGLTTPKTLLIKTVLAENQQSGSSKLKTTKEMSKSNASEYKCDICEKRFTFNYNLIRHLELHICSRDKPYKCDVCDKRFIRNAHLEEHKRVHTGEKPYKCTLCGKTFARKCSLRQHTPVHYPEGRHKCNICNKYFNRRGNLIEHTRVHTMKDIALDMLHTHFPLSHLPTTTGGS